MNEKNIELFNALVRDNEALRNYIEKQKEVNEVLSKENEKLQKEIDTWKKRYHDLSDSYCDLSIDYAKAVRKNQTLKIKVNVD